MTAQELLAELIDADVIRGFTTNRGVVVWTRGCGCCSMEADLSPDAQKALRVALLRVEGGGA